MVQHGLLQQINQKLPGGMDRYRTPPIAASTHDSSRYRYGAPLDALNNG